ncbi:hypothetical protein K1T35_48505 (plasmid) [Pseudonocardia sp. DSM 110487]|uniref:hypothetical protein n=1 Tax=Pseudonocardia sp. DSM 110487 TaxID=2865833 RepID=UPI001C6A5AAA|nr:hypothetical protein [Pseudonocardia sp. DSM 110487]QYN41190.1 hypothetical protein K1T35_48505 [Pseudonocardia sp. DSM 110487]
MSRADQLERLLCGLGGVSTASERRELRGRVEFLGDEERATLRGQVERQLRELYACENGVYGESGIRAAALNVLHDELQRPAGVPEADLLAARSKKERARVLGVLTPAQRETLAADNDAALQRLQGRNPGSSPEITRRQRLAAELSGRPAPARPRAGQAADAEPIGPDREQLTARERAAAAELARAREGLAAAERNAERVAGVAMDGRTANDPNLPLGQVVRRTGRQVRQAQARTDRDLAATVAAERRLSSAQMRARAAEAAAERATANVAAAASVTRENLARARFVRDQNGGWHRVKRVNAKSVTVPSVVGGSWDDRIPISTIVEVRT